jgi:hypothetical protein
MFGKFSACPWRCCGGLTKDILYQFIEGESHFGMPRGAKMSLASEHAPQVVNNC